MTFFLNVFSLKIIIGNIKLYLNFLCFVTLGMTGFQMDLFYKNFFFLKKQSGEA